MSDKVINVPLIGCVYKLRIKDHYYSGSSSDGMANRMCIHYNYSERKPDRKLCKFVIENGGWSKVTIEILLVSSSLTKEELRAEEDKHINLDDPLCLNTDRAFVPFEERKDRHNESCKKSWVRRTERYATEPELLIADREKQKLTQRSYRAKKKIQATPADETAVNELIPPSN